MMAKFVQWTKKFGSWGETAVEFIKKLVTRTPAVCPNSFPAGTPVLMGDGSTRPIEAVRTGDTVLATDPTASLTVPRRVDATIYTPDDRQFTDVTLAGGGSLTATSGHRFWNASERAWVDASRLRAGDSLLTPSGQQRPISATRQWEGLQAAYNLTVADLHTYYVLAGDTPVLVHNCVKAVALGYQGAGTAKWAEDLGFTHFMKPEFKDTWRGYVKKAIDDPQTEIHVNMKEFEGDFEQMAVTGLGGSAAGAKATQEEMSWIARAVIGERVPWSKFKFYDKDGKLTSIPEPKWHEAKWQKAWIFEWAD